MFTVYLVSFGYSLTPSFNSFEEAVAGAKKACFDASIHNEKNAVVGTWSTIGGLTDYRKFKRSSK